MTGIGQKIKDLRKKADLTQDRLADYLGVSSQAVSKWEVGQASPDLALIAPLCRVLGCSADELLGIADEREAAGKRLLDAHRHTMNNRAELGASDLCGCIYCRQVFRPQIITKWVDRDGNTALCPFCGIDSVIGSASGYALTEEFLAAMYERWFAPKTVPEPQDGGMTPGEFRDLLNRGLGRAILKLEKEKDKQILQAVWQRMLLYPEKQTTGDGEEASYFARPHDEYDRDLAARFDASGRLGEEVAKKILAMRPPHLSAMKLVYLLGHEEEATEILRADYERAMASLRQNLRKGNGDFRTLSDRWAESAYRLQDCASARKDVIQAQLYDLADLFRLAPPDRTRDMMDLFHHYTNEVDYDHRDVWDVLLSENPLSFVLSVSETTYSPLPKSELTVERILSADPSDADYDALCVGFRFVSDEVYFGVLDAAIAEEDPIKKGRLRSLFMVGIGTATTRDTGELIKRARNLLEEEKRNEDPWRRSFLFTLLHILAFVRDPQVRALGFEVIDASLPLLRHDGYRLAYGANFMPEDADLMEEWLKNPPDDLGFSPAYCVMAALRAGAEGVRDSWLRSLYENRNHRFMLVKTLSELGRLPDDMREESLFDEDPHIRQMARGELPEEPRLSTIGITWKRRDRGKE
ncbi:MAG: helix-turn-helix domain-containing protein [Clostridiales bacterium]|nr:helix-turn-helix domain-containing protein [Clostridiales bacterium]